MLSDFLQPDHCWVFVERGSGFSSLSLFLGPPAPASFLLFIYLFIYLFLAVLGLRFRASAFSSCGKRGPLFIAVHGPLTITASLAAEHRLQSRRVSSCGSRAQLLRGMWDLPRPGLEPVCPALAGRFSTTAPPGKPPPLLLLKRGKIVFLGPMWETLWHFLNCLVFQNQPSVENFFS